MSEEYIKCYGSVLGWRLIAVSNFDYTTDLKNEKIDRSNFGSLVS